MNKISVQLIGFYQNSFLFLKTSTMNMKLSYVEPDHRFMWFRCPLQLATDLQDLMQDLLVLMPVEILPIEGEHGTFCMEGLCSPIELWFILIVIPFWSDIHSGDQQLSKLLVSEGFLILKCNVNLGNPSGICMESWDIPEYQCMCGGEQHQRDECRLWIPRALRSTPWETLTTDHVFSVLILHQVR